MLEWLKTILGENYTEEIDKAVSKKIGEEFVSRTDFNAKNAAVKTLEGQLKDRDTQLDELKKVDTKAMQSEITRLQNDNKAAQKKYDEDMARIRLDSAIDAGIIAARGKNTVAVASLINREKLKLSNDNKTVEGLEDEIKRVKESADYLFEKVETSQEGSQSENHSGAGAGTETPPEDFSAYEQWREKHK